MTEQVDDLRLIIQEPESPATMDAKPPKLTSVNLAEEPEPTEDVPAEEVLKMYGSPYLIQAFLPDQTIAPEILPMMRLDPAIDAARAIIRDGSFWMVRVINNYSRLIMADFYRYAEPNGVKHIRETVTPA
jgi:hypothetical protein